MIDTVRGRISARQHLIAVFHRHIPRNVGTGSHASEIDRVDPLGQGVGDGEDLDLRGGGDAGIDLVECFCQILSIRAIEFLTVHRTGFTGEIGHSIGVSRSLHHIKRNITLPPVGLGQSGSIVVTVVIITTLGTCTMHTLRCSTPIIIRIAPFFAAPNRIIGYTERRIAIGQENDVLLHARASLQIIRLLKRSLPVGSTIRFAGHSCFNLADRCGEALLSRGLVAECHNRHLDLLRFR